MTIILFLIDTSASMCQKVHVNGVQKTYLDVAKGAVETFLKFRQRSQDCMGDRYMLLTFEDPPANVKAGWKENHATFMNELKNLQSNGLTCMGEALKNGFDLLNLNRMQSGIDTYGQGRCPFYLETSVIIVITDGGKYSLRNGVHKEIVLPLHAQIPGTKLTKEPFRWDQRLFSLVLRMAGHRVDERIDVKVPHDDSPIEKMCEVTGGRSYKVRSHYVLNHCIESLVQKVQPGVVVQFDPPMPPLDAELPDLVFPMTKKMIYVQKNMSNKSYPVGYWPLPEPYWPDPKAVQLPPRDAHPRIRVLTPCVDEPVPVRNFPVDKYELEASPLTMQILARRELSRCWPVVVVNSGPGAMGPGGLPMPHELPFGYLKANNTFTQVYLVVLPINYSVLLPLLNDLFHRYMCQPPNDWMYKFSNYVRSLPQYYCPFLRRALAAISVPYQLLNYILPENLDSYLSPAVANHLKALKNQAKQELEALCLRIFKQMKQPRPAHRQVETAKLMPILALGAAPAAGTTSQTGSGSQLPQQQATIAGGPRKEMVSHPMLRDTFTKVHSDCQVYDNYTIVVPVATIRGQLTSNAPVTHATANAMNVGGGGGGGNMGMGPGPVLRASRNPFDIRRRDLVDEISRMRENFFKMVGPSGGLAIGPGAVAVNGAAGHCLPISEMGNYQEYLKNKETPLREIEPTNVRQHMFGNPYKKDKHMVMVDEADMVGDVAPMMKTGGGPVAMGVGGVAGPSGAPQLIMGKKMEGGVSKMSRKRKAGPIARDFKFRRLSTSSQDSFGSSESGGSSEYGSSIASDDFDDEEQRLVMDFDEVAVVSSAAAVGGGGENAEMIIEREVSEEGAAASNGDQEGRLNGMGGLPSVNHEEVQSMLSDRLLGLGQGQSIPTLQPSVPTLLTPSEGVLSPMYQQPLIGLPITTVASVIGGGAAAATETSQQLTTLTGSPSILIGNAVSPIGTSSADSRKYLANGGGGSSTGATPITNTIGLERATSSSLSSNFNDADEISKILQQSCSQHNGTGSSSDQDHRKNNSRSVIVEAISPPETTTTSTTSSSTSTIGRKRRQMNKQASAELLEIVTGDANEEKESGMGGCEVTVGTAPNRRQSPRMAEGSASNRSNSNSNSAQLHDRLSGGLRDTSSSIEENHVKSSWSTVKRSATMSSGSSNHTSIKEEDVGSGDGITMDGWEANGESLDVIREANYEARTVVFHDIRRPGRDYRLLLEHLELIRGDFETRFAFIQMCIAEAMRFHRKKMATTIQEWWDQKIDRITTRESSNAARVNEEHASGESEESPTKTAAVEKTTATTTKDGHSKGRQKSSVKLRSGTNASSATASKC